MWVWFPVADRRYPSCAICEANIVLSAQLRTNFFISYLVQFRGEEEVRTGLVLARGPSWHHAHLVLAGPKVNFLVGSVMVAAAGSVICKSQVYSFCISRLVVQKRGPLVRLQPCLASFNGFLNLVMRCESCGFETRWFVGNSKNCTVYPPKVLSGRSRVLLRSRQHLCPHRRVLLLLDRRHGTAVS